MQPLLRGTDVGKEAELRLEEARAASLSQANGLVQIRDPDPSQTHTHVGRLSLKVAGQAQREIPTRRTHARSVDLRKQLSHRPPEDGVPDVGRNLGQRHEHARLLVQGRMRHTDIRLVDDGLVVQQDVQVYRPWPGPVRRLTPEAVLDALKKTEE